MAAIAADGASSMLDSVQGRDTSVRDTISKGRFVQGAQHPKIFGRGHIGQGHLNPASIFPGANERSGLENIDQSQRREF